MQSVLGNTRKIDLVFHRSGRIDITAHVAKILLLSRGDVIDILAGDAETYLYVRLRSPLIGRHEGMVYPSNKRGSHFRTSSKSLCRFILDKCGKQDSVSLFVGQAVCDHLGRILLPIIIKNCI